MEMSASHRIQAPRQQIWDALNDPKILKASIRGCESLERSGDDSFAVTVLVKVGPIKARFQGAVLLTDIDAPSGYTIVGEGKGGVAGFAKGKAFVTLTEEAGETVLNYKVEAALGGKLAQLGSRMIDGVAKKEADAFFATFIELAKNYSAVES
jgi:uncharacterized protein